MAKRRPLELPVSPKDIERFEKAQRKCLELKTHRITDKMAELYLESDSIINTSDLESDSYSAWTDSEQGEHALSFFGNQNSY